MKRLLLIGSGYIHTYNFANLVEPYFDEVLLIADKVGEGQHIKTVVLDFSLKKIWNQVTTVQSIRRIIAEFKPSVIHIHQANSFAFYALRAASASSIPTVLTAWGSDVLLLPQSGFLMRKMVTYNLKRPTALTADAHFMAVAMARLSGRDISEITIANFGIEQLERKTEKENIIYSNRLHKPLYRVDKIIRAFQKFHLTGEGKKWLLYIGATGAETPSLTSLVKELGLDDAVVFLGWVDKDKNAEMYARAKVYISIPESDGTSISLLEAMYYGCLPIVSDLPANREWIEDLRNGYLVKNMDEDFISRALQTDLRQVAERNREIIEGRATKAVNRIKFYSIYDALINPNRSNTKLAKPEIHA